MFRSKYAGFMLAAFLLLAPAAHAADVAGVVSVNIARVGGAVVTAPAIENTSVTPTVTASSAYASGNAVGGLITFTNAVASVGEGGLVQSFVINTLSAQTFSADIILFNANPSASTCTDKSAVSIAAGDSPKIVGVIHLSDWTSVGTPSVGQAQNLAMPFSPTVDTSLYACLVTRGTPTFGSTSGVTVSAKIIRN